MLDEYERQSSDTESSDSDSRSENSAIEDRSPRDNLRGLSRPRDREIRRPAPQIQRSEQGLPRSHNQNMLNSIESRTDVHAGHTSNVYSGIGDLNNRSACPDFPRVPVASGA